MPGPDGYKELCSCQNVPLSKTYYPPEPPLKGEKWCRATDFIDAPEKDHHRWASQHSTSAAQNPHQATATQGLVAATQGLVAATRIKPIPKPRLLKAHFNADHPQSVNNRNVDYVVPASDPTCSGWNV